MYLSPAEYERFERWTLLNILSQRLTGSNGVTWAHFTDISDRYTDFMYLLEHDFLSYYHLKYQKNGTWQDYFPPSSYRITEKGRIMLDNPYDYIYNDVLQYKKDVKRGDNTRRTHFSG